MKLDDLEVGMQVVCNGQMHVVTGFYNGQVNLGANDWHEPHELQALILSAENLKDYLKENLMVRVEYNRAYDCDVIQLVLDGEIISSTNNCQ